MKVSIQEIQQRIEAADLDSQFEKLYPSAAADIQALKAQRLRYNSLLTSLAQLSGVSPGDSSDVSLLSVPGRTELAGNHTDHNGGRVLAASVQLDIAGAAIPGDDSQVIIRSQGFEELKMDLKDLSVREDEKGSMAALVRGVAAWFSQNGYKIGGFSAAMHSMVPPGSGLSSSAAFEVMVASIFNQLYNNGSLGSLSLALAGKYAENDYFGKPSGLMDQIACAHGGIVEIDFANDEKPEIQQVNYDFTSRGYILAIVNSGGSHADLTDEYAAVPEEMTEVARALGGKKLCDISTLEFYKRLPELRNISSVSDRGLLRAMHFFNENGRVDSMLNALETDNLGEYLRLVRESGSSSMRFLQNVTPPGAVNEQNLALTSGMVENCYGSSVAIRVHGGGFEGSLQFYAAMEAAPDVIQDLIALCGEDSVEMLHIRPQGAYVMELGER